MKVFLIVVIVMVVLLLGALGYVVLDKRINGDDAASSSGGAPAESSRAEDTKSEVVEKSPLKDAVSEINQVLASGLCGNGLAEAKVENFVVVDSKDAFVYEGGESRIDKGLGYAYVQYGCGSQGGVALMKRDKEEWRVVSSDPRIYPLCGSVRERGFPLSVIDKCYENTSSREPIAL